MVPAEPARSVRRCASARGQEGLASPRVRHCDHTLIAGVPGVGHGDDPRVPAGVNRLLHFTGIFRTMLYVDIPTRPEIKALVEQRADACVSLFVATSPETQKVGQARIAFGNLVREALAQLDAAGFDKRRRAALVEQFDDLAADDDFWTFQAHSLAVLATPDGIRTFRLPNRLTDMVQVSDRFHLKPLLRAITFPHQAFVLALAEKGPRLVHVLADLPAEEVRVHALPKDAGSATGRASVNDRSPSGRIQGGRVRRCCCASMPARSTPRCGRSWPVATSR